MTDYMEKLDKKKNIVNEDLLRKKFLVGWNNLKVWEWLGNSADCLFIAYLMVIHIE